MSDYSKLKNYLSETNGGSSSSGNNPLMSGLNSVKSSFGDFFGNGGKSNVNVNGTMETARNLDDQTDSWFKDADSDPYCPKLVTDSLYLLLINFAELQYFLKLCRRKLSV
jgi:hypothetical protein